MRLKTKIKENRRIWIQGRLFSTPTDHARVSERTCICTERDILNLPPPAPAPSLCTAPSPSHCPCRLTLLDRVTLPLPHRRVRIWWASSYMLARTAKRNSMSSLARATTGPKICGCDYCFIPCSSVLFYLVYFPSK